MAITNIKSCRNVAKAINYVLYDEPHSANEYDRNILTYCHGCTEGTAIKFFEEVIDYYDKKKNIHAYTLVVSWDLDELDPYSDEDVERGLELCKALTKEIFTADRQCVIAMQRDGTGGRLHSHIIVNSVDFRTGKSMRRGTNHASVMKISDRLHKEMNILNKNRDCDYANTLVNDRPVKFNEYNMMKRLGDTKEQKTKSWKYELKQLIEQALQNLSGDFTPRAFINEINKLGVSTTVNNNCSKTTDGKSITYTFIDSQGKQRKIRDYKLSEEYTTIQVKARINKLKDTEYKAVQVERVPQPLIRSNDTTTTNKNVDTRSNREILQDMELARQKQQNKQAMQQTKHNNGYSI